MMLLLKQGAELPSADIQREYELIAIHRGGNRVQVIKNRMGPPLGVMSMTDFDLIVRKFLHELSKNSLDESVRPQ